MTTSAWYPDRIDGLWTLDYDGDNDQIIEWQITGRYSVVTGVELGSLVADPTLVNSPTVSVSYFDNSVIQLRVKGSGFKVPVTVTFGGGQKDQITLRFRAVSA